MKITEEQLKDLHFFKDMFERHAEYLENICERGYNEMATGYHLGTTSSYLKQHHNQIKELIDKIEDENRG